MALSADRKLDYREYGTVEYGYLVQQGFTVFRGSIVAICSDKTIIPNGAAGSPAAVAVVGIAERQASNITTAGITSSLNNPAGYVRCRRGSFQVPFDTAPPASAIGATVYAIDDQTVSLSSASGAHLPCGVLEGFDQAGNPWTRF
jgi:hypothetical protein